MLASLAGLALRRGGFRAIADAVIAPTLVVHAADDHYVPVDFAVGAARGRSWDVVVLDHGGHLPHAETPDAWLATVSPWLTRLAGQT